MHISSENNNQRSYNLDPKGFGASPVHVASTKTLRVWNRRPQSPHTMINTPHQYDKKLCIFHLKTTTKGEEVDLCNHHAIHPQNRPFIRHSAE